LPGKTWDKKGLTRKGRARVQKQTFRRQENTPKETGKTLLSQKKTQKIGLGSEELAEEEREEVQKKNEKIIMKKS